MTEARWYVVNAAGNMHSCGSEDIASQKAKVFDARNSEYGPHRVVQLVDAAELEKLKALLKEAADYLDTGVGTSIGQTSILHRKFREASQ